MKIILSIIGLSIFAFLSKDQIDRSTQGTEYPNQLPCQVPFSQANGNFHEDGSPKYMTPDYFEIDSSQFEKFKSGRYANWFVTNDRKSRLYFVPYTDYSITTAVLTDNGKLPKDIIGLLDFGGIKYRDIDKAIQSNNIISKKGFKLGTTKQFAIDRYGVPGSKKKNGDLETLTWNFKMKEFPVNYKIGPLTPYVLEGLAFDIELSFKKNRLCTLIYRYEVP
jgi:hypothetical protein